MPRKLKSVLIDFDGVLHAYTSGWLGPAEIPDGPVPGAMRWLRDMVRNFSVTIYSARGRDTDGLWAMKEAIRKWCREEKIPNQDAEAMLGRMHWATDKPVAWLTIDDRAWRFDGKFPKISEVDEFKPWNQTTDRTTDTNAESPAPTPRRARSAKPTGSA